MKILIVEDDKVFGDVIMKTVRKWGYKTEKAESGKEAMEKIRKESFDLVLLDLLLPDCKGYELISQFRRVWPDIDVVTMTAYNSRDIESKVRKQSVAFYMSKPFSMKQLRTALDHIRRKKLQYETTHLFYSDGASYGENSLRDL
ncbi:MAG: response regulator [Deltaproteobacteria bacterium]|nr:response regulator [Deltaproteobacteria bacterium]